MRNALALFVAVLLAAVLRSEEPDSVAGVYRGSSGIETRRVTLLTNGHYLARWDGDIASNGSSTGTWELIGGEVRLSPRKEEGMISGYFTILLVRSFEGRRALLRKEDEENADNPLFHLFLQTNGPDQPSQPTRGKAIVADLKRSAKDGDLSESLMSEKSRPRLAAAKTYEPEPIRRRRSSKISR